jgi:hypothetical protein
MVAMLYAYPAGTGSDNSVAIASFLQIAAGAQ